MKPPRAYARGGFISSAESTEAPAFAKAMAGAPAIAQRAKVDKHEH